MQNLTPEYKEIPLKEKIQIPSSFQEQPSQIVGGWLSTSNQLTKKSDTTLHAVYEAVVDVGGYGDFSTIQKAIDEGKKRIFIRGGIHTITSAILITQSNILLEGEDSSNTILKLADGTNDDVIRIDGDTTIFNVSIKNLQIDGNKANQSVAKDGIYAKGSYAAEQILYLTIEDCYIRDCKNNGLNLTVASWSNINRNFVYNNDDAGISLNGVSTRNNVINNICWDNKNGIEVITPASEILVSGNQCVGSSADAIYISGEENIISNNQCNASTNTGVRNLGSRNIIFGNQINNNTGVDGGILVSDGDGAIVIGNEVYSNTYSGINLAGSANNPSNALIKDNYANGNDIGISIASSTLNCVVEDNYTTANTSFQISDAGNNTIIRNNKGFNPIGLYAVTVGASPFTFTAGSSPVTLYINGGTVSDISKSSITLFTDTGHSLELEPFESVIITYSVLPTVIRDIH